MWSEFSKRPLVGTLVGSLMGTLLCIALLVGCGGAAAGGAVQPSSPFTAQDGQVFDHTVDLLADPAGLEGAWAVNWRRELELLTGRADVVAVVDIETIVADIDLEKHKAFRLVPVEVRGLRGRLPEGASLRVSQGSAGYASVDANRRELMDGQYLLFVKWYRADDGNVQAHWHLAQATPPILEIVEELLGLREAPSSRVIIRKN